MSSIRLQREGDTLIIKKGDGPSILPENDIEDIAVILSTYFGRKIKIGKPNVPDKKAKTPSKQTATTTG